MVPINYWAVLVAAVANMVVGSLWYGPIFGKMWIGMMGFTEEQMKAAREKGMTKSYALALLSSLFMSWILAHAIIFASAYLMFYGALAGVVIGFLNWLGFVMPITLGTVLWEGRSWKLWSLNAGCYLVSLCLMGAILASWT